MGLFGDAPERQTVLLDPTAKRLIDDQSARASESDKQIAGHLNQGVEVNANQMLQGDQSLQEQAAGSAQDPAMLQAIRNQYNQKAGNEINQVVKQNEMSTSLRRNHMMQQRASYHVAQQNIETQNYMALTKAMNDADAARAQVLNSIFGAVGMAGGMYAASRGGKPKETPTTPVEQPYGKMRDENTAGGPFDTGGQDPFSVA